MMVYLKRDPVYKEIFLRAVIAFLNTDIVKSDPFEKIRGLTLQQSIIK
jgi:hypothetical protein